MTSVCFTGHRKIDRLLLRRCSRLRHYVRSYGTVSEKTQGTRYKAPPCTPLLKRGADKELELQRQAGVLCDNDGG